MSLAGRIAWTVAFLQCFVVVMTLVVILVTGGAVVFETWWTPAKAVSLLVLMVVIPALVYYSARLWFHYETVYWRDIDKAWHEAMIEVDRHGISLSSTPLFIVLGGDGGPRDEALFAKCPVHFDVHAAPSGSAPFHVYAGPEAIFVCLATVGQTCKVMSQQGSSLQDATVGLRSGERVEASDRMRTLCERIRNARQPVAPANGVIALVPAAHPDQQRFGTTVGSALSEDMITIAVTFGLRIPVTMVGVGVEAVPGFDTLLNRLPAGTATIAMGEAFPVGRIPSEGDIELLTTAACGRLSDRAGNILLDPKSLPLSQENRLLVALLCHLRLEVAPLLAGILKRGLEYASHSDAKPVLAGCYLMPVSTEAQAVSFNTDLFSRVIEVQGELEWTQSTLQRHRQYGYVARALMALNTLMGIAWVAILWWRLSR